MKNVFKRCIKLVSLFDSSNTVNLDSNYIKDNISDYRNLSDSAFKRSFERDKSILKEIGFNLEYENDKWNLEDGYTLKGTNIIKDLEKQKNFDIDTFINTFFVIKKYLSPYFFLNEELKIIPKLNEAIRDKRRVSFTYKGKLRKLYPLGLRFYGGKWYLGAEDQKNIKTFLIKDILNLKIGTKANLHENTISKFDFSWEENSPEVTIEFLIDPDLHKIHNNIFNYYDEKLIKEDNKLNISLKTNDHFGLIKYLLLAEPQILKMSNEDKNLLHGVLNGF